MIYGKDFFVPKTLTYYAQEAIGTLKQINQRSSPSNPPIKYLLSTGSSGCSLASAMLVLSPTKLNHMYVRKETDTTGHTNWYTGVNLCSHAVIVDDIIDTGDTIEYLLSQVEKYTSVRVRAIIVVASFIGSSDIQGIQIYTLRSYYDK